MNGVSPTASSASSTSAFRCFLPRFLCRSGSTTLFRTDDQGISERPYSWKTSAISSGGTVTRLPRKRTSPLVGRSSPPTHFRSVVLPHPDGPTTQTNSRSSTVNETSAIAWVTLAPLPYVFASFLISSSRSPLVLIAPLPLASRDATRGRDARGGSRAGSR